MTMAAHDAKLQIETLLPLMSTTVQNKLDVHVFLLSSVYFTIPFFTHRKENLLSVT